MIEREHIISGIVYRIASAFAFSAMGALLKLASQAGLNAPELVFYRSLFSIPIVLLWALTWGSLSSLRPKRAMAHVWRSALGLVSMGFFYQSLILLSLGDFTALSFTAPIFATILSFIFLKEQVGVHRWAAVLVGFVGVLVIARPGAGGLPAAGLVAALLAALAGAAVTITLRQIQKEGNVAAIVFWFAIAGVIAGAMFMPVFGQRHGLWTMMLVAAGGLTGGIGQFLMTASLRAPVSVISPFDYLQIITATIFGWLIFSDAPRLHTCLGAILIGLSGLYTVWREHRRRVGQDGTGVRAI